MVSARLDRYFPVNGHVVIECGLLTAVDLVVLALARCPGVTGCGILTAAGLAWDCSRRDRLWLLPAIGLGGSVCVHMFVGRSL